MDTRILDGLKPINELKSPEQSSQQISKGELKQSPNYQSGEKSSSLSESSKKSSSRRSPSIQSNNIKPAVESPPPSPTKIRNDNLLLTDPEHQTQKSNFDDSTQEILTVGQVPPQLLAKNLIAPVRMEDYVLSSPFKRVTNNISNALTFLHKPTKSSKDARAKKERLGSWKEKLESEENHLIINDGFWLVVLKKNKSKFIDEDEVRKLNKRLSLKKKRKKITVLGYVKEDQVEKLTKGQQLYKDIENAILDRMAVNYIRFLDKFEGRENEKFFEVKF